MLSLFTPRGLGLLWLLTGGLVWRCRASCRIRSEGIVDGGPGKDGIPSIDNPRFIASEFADLSDASIVVGVVDEINGTARAFPTSILRYHEIVNFDFGGVVRLAMTWSVFSRSAVSFHIADEHHSFGTSGKLYENNLVMYDRGSGHDWVQLLARQTLSCERLKRIPVLQTRWGTWRKLYPHTQLLSTRTGFDRDYSNDPYPGYDRDDDIYFVTSWRKDASPYGLHSRKSTTRILSTSFDQHYLFPSGTLYRGAHGFRLVNDSVKGLFPKPETVTLHEAMYAFDLDAHYKGWMKSYVIVVANDEPNLMYGAWIVITESQLKWPLDINAFHIANFSKIVSEGPNISWNWTDTFVESVALDDDNITARYLVIKLPLYDAFWFAATSMYPTANILVNKDGSLVFTAYDPDIIYSQPWRPWMIAILVVFGVVGFVGLSMGGFTLFHLVHRKRHRRLDAASEGTLRQEELQLLVDAGLIPANHFSSTQSSARLDAE